MIEQGAADEFREGNSWGKMWFVWGCFLLKGCGGIYQKLEK